MIARLRFVVLVIVCSFALMSCANFGGPALSVNGNEYSRTDMDDLMQSTVEFMNAQALQGADPAAADSPGVELLDSTLPAELSAGVTELLIINDIFRGIIDERGVEILAQDRAAVAGLLPFEGEPEGLLENLLLDFRVNEAALARDLNQSGESFPAVIAAADIDVDLDPRYGEWDDALTAVVPPTGPGLVQPVDVG